MVIESADDRSNQGIWQEMLGQTDQNAKLLAGWASNGITMRLLSTEYRLLSISRSGCLEVARTV
jgi:hypothetical protein